MSNAIKPHMSKAIKQNDTYRMRPLALMAATAAAIVLTLGLSTSAPGNFKTLSLKLPASSNAIVAINVTKVLNTPYAKAEWAPNTPEAWAKEPVMIPPGAERLLMAAEVQSNMESLWEMSLMEMPTMPSVQSLAAAEGGYIDRLWDKDAACSPINAYFVPLDGKVLASVTPANRSAVTKWLRTPTTRPDANNVTSRYIQRVLVGLGDNTDIVMALDLEGAFGVPNIRRWLDENDIKELKTEQLDEVARTLGTMNGIALTISVDKDVTARATVDFDKDVTALKDSAKSIMIEVLNTAGMRIDDIRDWNVSVTGKQISMDGKLSTPSLRKLLGIVQSPIPAATVAKGPAGGGGQATSAAPATPAEASQRYYKAVCSYLDNFRPGSSPSETATWARATTKRIDQLPILNVDQALVQWGSMVSTRLKQAAGGVAVGQTQMNARVAGVMDPSYSQNSYYNSGTGYTNDVNRADVENAKRQRRQAALEQKAQAQEAAMRILSEIAETRPQIRALMVEKYKVEF